MLLRCYYLYRCYQLPFNCNVSPTAALLFQSEILCRQSIWPFTCNAVAGAWRWPVTDIDPSQRRHNDSRANDRPRRRHWRLERRRWRHFFAFYFLHSWRPVTSTVDTVAIVIHHNRSTLGQDHRNGTAHQQDYAFRRQRRRRWQRRQRRQRHPDSCWSPSLRLRPGTARQTQRSRGGLPQRLVLAGLPVARVRAHVATTGDGRNAPLRAAGDHQPTPGHVQSRRTPYSGRYPPTGLTANLWQDFD